MKRNTAVIFWVAALEASFLPLVFLSFRRSSHFLGYFEQIRDHLNIISFCFLFMFAVYALGVWYADRLSVSLSPRRLALILAPFLLLLVVTPPMLSRDPAGYFVVAKNTVAFGANPYRDVAGEFSENPWLDELGGVWWQDEPTPYGPLFLAVMLPFAALPIGNLSVGIGVFKLFLAIAFGASFFVFNKLRIALKLPSAALLLYALNPAILLYGVLEGHNDLIVMILLLCTVIVFERPRPSGHFALAAAVAVKYVPVILLPMSWFENRRIVWKRVFWSLGGLASVMLVTTAVYGFPFHAMFKSVLNQGTQPCFLYCSPVLNILAGIFGYSGYRIAGLLLFGASFLFCAYHFLWQRNDRVPFIFFVLLSFFAFALTWLTPWYFIWLVPFGILLSGRFSYRLVFTGIMAVSLLFYIGYL